MDLSTIYLIPEEQASGEVKTIYEEVKRYYGLTFVPEMFKALAHNPQWLRQTWEMLRTSEEQMGRERVHVIGLTTATCRSCTYAISFHTAILKQLGWNDQQIEQVAQTISAADYWNTYSTCLNLEPDVTPSVVSRRAA
jgi:AhpD family alkylhydroperoxidase